MPDKITISYDEVTSAAVDEKLRQSLGDGAGRSTTPAEKGGFKWSQLLYNTLVYSSLFGLVGGLAAGLLGELYWLGMPSGVEEYWEYFLERNSLELDLESGEMSQTEFDRQLADLDRKYADNPRLKIENDASLSEFEREEQLERLDGREGIRTLLMMIFWYASVGMLLAVALSIADQAMGHNLRGVFVNGSIAIALSLVGTIFGACIANVVYSRLGGGGDENIPLQIFARAIGWGLFGLCLSAAPGIVLKNWKRLIIGLAGGLIGGTLGGALFDPIVFLTESDKISRVVGIVAIGMLTGLGTGLLETAAKTGWVRVTHGLIAGKQFILYKDTTYIGSSPQCEIYLFKDTAISPRHAAIHRRGNSHELEDLQSATATYVNGAAVSRTRLKNGDRIQIGGTVLMFLERSRRSK